MGETLAVSNTTAKVSPCIRSYMVETYIKIFRVAAIASRS